jgi:hypothetical protein
MSGLKGLALSSPYARVLASGARFLRYAIDDQHLAFHQ